MDNETLLFDRLEMIKTTINKYGEDKFYISFSGGKDSTVLHYLVDMALPNNKIPRVFSNTGVEHRKIVEFVKSLAENDKRFEKFFAVMLLLPFTPDNILCFIAGTTKISFKRYALIVLLFKLWKIGFFCYGVDFCIDIFKIIG